MNPENQSGEEGVRLQRQGSSTFGQ
jgi:hypothetical protein